MSVLESKSWVLRFISKLLIFAMLFSLLPPQGAFAVSEDFEFEYMLEEESVAIKEKVIRLGEITSKRERNKKFFLNSDNTITAEIHTNSIHYPISGKWADIDNTLIEDKSVSERPLRNKSNDMDIRLAKNYKGNNMLASIKIDNYSLFISPVDAASVSSEPSTNSSGVIFKDIYPGIDFEYIVDYDQLKENIIVNSYTGKNSFSFNLQTNQLTPSLDGNDLFFKNKQGEDIFVIPAPFMYDQTRAECHEFVVTLDTSRGQTYTLTYEADETWLTDSQRKYPVVIDPLVIATRKTDHINDTFLSEANPTKNYQLRSYLKTGWSESTYNRTRTLFKFPGMPSSPVINAADEIIKAELSFYQSWDILVDGGIDQTVTVNVHKVTSDWAVQTVTWNNQPSYDPRVYDYERCKSMARRTFDITPIVKGWYNGEPNHGVLIKHQSETEAIFDFNSSNHSTPDSRPVMAITYRNQSGLEGYLSYTTLDLGRSGSASVNNYNGNLIYSHSDLSLSGNRMPLYISHVYNSDSKEANIGYGNGWRLNLAQTVRPITIGELSYAEYTDGDGTIHHFYYEEGQYYLQTPGIYLNLVKNADGTFTLTDNQNNEMQFDISGNLVEIENNQGDKILVYYSSGKISRVTDGAGREATLTYTDNVLTKITDPVGRETIYSYESSNLVNIRYPDHTTQSPAETTLIYDAKKISKVTHPGGQSLQLQYQQDNDVEKISYYGSDIQLGQSYEFNYWINTTLVTDNNNKTTTYLFNNSGNPKNIIDSQGNAAYLGFQDNLLINQMPFRSTTINLLKNHNLERSSDWSLVHEGSSTASGGYVSGESYLGNQSLRIIKDNTAGLSQYRQSVTVSKGNTYTLSAHLKTSDISNSNNGAARLVVRHRDSSGSWVEHQSLSINGSHDWQRLYLTFTVPPNASSGEVQIGLAIVGETGTVWYDNPQLEEGPAPTSYNLVENSSLELDSSGNGIPDQWLSGGLTSSDILVTSQKYFDDRSFRFLGHATTNKYISQRIEVSGSKDETFVLSGWAKAQAVPRTEQKATRRFGLCVGFYGDSDTKWQFHYFNDDYTGWQYLSGIVKAPFDYNYVRIYGLYYHNANEAYFDGFQLNKELVTSYTYDDSGNIISVTDQNNSQTNFTYSSDNDLIKAVDPKGGNYSYQYNSRHNLLSALSPSGTTYSFNHDSFGNLTDSSFGHIQNVNYLNNGDFTDLSTHWNQSAEDNSGVMTVDPDNGARGPSALKLVSNPGSVGGHLSAYQLVSVKPSTSYTLSGMIKTQLVEGKAYYVIEELNSSNQVTKTTTNSYATLTGDNDWISRAVTFETRSDTTKVRVYLRLAHGGQEIPDPEGEGTIPPENRYTTVTRPPSKDATAVSTAAGTSYGTANWLGVGRKTNGATYQTTLGFSLPTEVQGKKILEAKLYMYFGDYAETSSSTSAIAIYDAISTWSQTSLTWNNFPTRNEPQELTWQCPGQDINTLNQENAVDITAIVQRWADEYTSATNGIILRQINTTNGTYKNFHSREHSNVNLRPRLEIKYDTEDSYRIIANSDDARVNSKYPSNNYGSQTYTRAGYTSSLLHSEAWFKFPLTSIPSNSRIDSATLEITEYDSSSASTSSSVVSVHRSLANWNEGTITWSNKPSYVSTPSAAISVSTQTDYGIRQWDVTDLIRGYHSNSYGNYGIALRSNLMKYFNTKEDSQKYRHPRLRVEFTVDDSGPVISYSPSFGPDSVNVGLSFYDEVTGYKRHSYQWTSTPNTPTTWSSWYTSSSPNYTSPGPGIWYLHVQAEDNVGNVSTSYGGQSG